MLRNHMQVKYFCGHQSNCLEEDDIKHLSDQQEKRLRPSVCVSGISADYTCPLTPALESAVKEEEKVKEEQEYKVLLLLAESPDGRQRQRHCSPALARSLAHWPLLSIFSGPRDFLGDAWKKHWKKAGIADCRRKKRRKRPETGCPK